MSAHVHGFTCPETPEHANTPLYDAAAFDAGFAPMPVLAEVRAEYERQVADGHARGGAA